MKLDWSNVVSLDSILPIHIHNLKFYCVSTEVWGIGNVANITVPKNVQMLHISF